jgi:hypothetical protein
MAFALAIRNTSTPARRLILTTTSIIVIVTVIGCGGFTNKMLMLLGFRYTTFFRKITHKSKIREIVYILNV